MIKVLKKSAEFEKIIAEDKNVLVDFNATWCGPCRMMGRVIEEIEAEYPELTFLKVDTDDFPEIAQRFMIASIPSMLAYKNGNRIDFSFNGNKQDMQIGSMMEDDFKLLVNETFGF